MTAPGRRDYDVLGSLGFSVSTVAWLLLVFGANRGLAPQELLQWVIPTFWVALVAGWALLLGWSFRSATLKGYCYAYGFLGLLYWSGFLIILTLPDRVGVRPVTETSGSRPDRVVVRGPAFCMACGYDLSGCAASSCPECGRAFLAFDRNTYRAHPPTPWWRPTARRLALLVGMIVVCQLLAGFSTLELLGGLALAGAELNRHSGEIGQWVALSGVVLALGWYGLLAVNSPAWNP